ncbi:Insulin-degrading enzyme [Rhynchospora pubera]|uniref:Insulin-degrading enzyme n=1 Tax=Rhynchospora pubera TaxID=906938 RepID=A0AAV8EXI6_9POAL|nr:Insulin-degrading enzyme [Rhynchospora pubera]
MARVSDVEFIRSQRDTRDYRRIILPNSLQVMLISDAEIDKAAAVMRVSVGAFSDPDGINGLAHFLEHMLFYASEKYPEENSYSKYITEHGGSTNATTGSESTNFYFDVNVDNFNEALDRFAQFFVKPLMSADAVNREINAVDSGWAMGLMAGAGSDSNEYSFFSVSIRLTDEGHDHMEDIVGIVFKYIDLLKGSEIHKWFFDELVAMCETEFNYQDKCQPLNYALFVNGTMPFFPPEEWLVGESLPSKFDPILIQKKLDELSPDKVRIFWESKKFEGSTDLTEPWYGTSYSVQKITPDTIKQWKNNAPDADLHLPEPNIFIPTDFTLHAPKEEAISFFLINKIRKTIMMFNS